MRNNKGSAPLHQGQKCLLNSHLRGGINRGSRLIQDQHRRIAQHNAGDTKQLLLPLRQAAAVLTDLGIIPLRQTLNKAVGVCFFGCRHDFIIRSAGIAHADILQNRAALEPSILQHHTKILAQRLAANLLHRGAVYGNLTPLHIVKAHKQVD